MSAESQMLHPTGRILVFSVAASLLLAIAPALCVATGGSEKPGWSLTTRQEHVYPGEPLVAVVECNAPGIARASLAGMRIVDANGFEVSPGYVRAAAESERVYAEAPERLYYRRYFVANGWCSTMLAPGRYRLELDLHFNLAAEHKTVVLSDGSTLTTFGPEYPASVTASFEIIPIDRPDYETRLAALAAMTESGTQEGRAKLERALACEMLAVAQGDPAVPYQLRIAGGSLDTYYVRTALASLVKGGSLAAAQGLVEILDANSYTIQWIKTDIVEAIYALRDNGDPRVLAVTDAVVRDNKRIRPPVPPTKLSRQCGTAGGSYLVIY
jgi:hypothetical protein